MEDNYYIKSIEIENKHVYSGMIKANFGVTIEKIIKEVNI